MTSHEGLEVGTKFEKNPKEKEKNKKGKPYLAIKYQESERKKRRVGSSSSAEATVSKDEMVLKQKKKKKRRQKKKAKRYLVNEEKSIPANCEYQESERKKKCLESSSTDEATVSKDEMLLKQKKKRKRRQKKKSKRYRVKNQEKSCSCSPADKSPKTDWNSSEAKQYIDYTSDETNIVDLRFPISSSDVATNLDLSCSTDEGPPKNCYSSDEAKKCRPSTSSSNLAKNTNLSDSSSSADEAKITDRWLSPHHPTTTTTTISILELQDEEGIKKDYLIKKTSKEICQQDIYAGSSYETSDSSSSGHESFLIMYPRERSSEETYFDQDSVGKSMMAGKRCLENVAPVLDENVANGDTTMLQAVSVYAIKSWHPDKRSEVNALGTRPAEEKTQGELCLQQVISIIGRHFGLSEEAALITLHRHKYNILLMLEELQG